MLEPLSWAVPVSWVLGRPFLGCASGGARCVALIRSRSPLAPSGVQVSCGAAPEGDPSSECPGWLGPSPSRACRACRAKKSDYPVIGSACHRSCTRCDPQTLPHIRVVAGHRGRCLEAAWKHTAALESHAGGAEGQSFHKSVASSDGLCQSHGARRSVACRCRTVHPGPPPCPRHTHCQIPLPPRGHETTAHKRASSHSESVVHCIPPPRLLKRAHKDRSFPARRFTSSFALSVLMRNRPRRPLRTSRSSPETAEPKT